MSRNNDNDKTEEMAPEAQAEQSSKSEQDNSGASEEGNETESLSETEQLEQALAAEKDKFLRLFAEFENYKKRTTRERMELFKTAGQEVITALLPVMDDFDRALKELKRSEDEELFRGVGLISNKFRETLKSKGLEEITVKEGDTFDAELHEAVTQIPAPKKSLKGKVIDVIEKGFKLGDRIIRHPKVVVGN
jgi:molecular chaperone GrpE